MNLNTNVISLLIHTKVFSRGFLWWNERKMSHTRKLTGEQERARAWAPNRCILCGNHTQTQQNTSLLITHTYTATVRQITNTYGSKNECWKSTINNQCLCDNCFIFVSKEVKEQQQQELGTNVDRRTQSEWKWVVGIWLCVVICQPPESISTTDWLTDKTSIEPCELGIITHVPIFAFACVQRIGIKRAKQ